MKGLCEPQSLFCLSLVATHFCAGELPFPNLIGLQFTLVSREEARALGDDDGDDGVVKLLYPQVG